MFLYVDYYKLTLQVQVSQEILSREKKVFVVYLLKLYQKLY